MISFRLVISLCLISTLCLVPGAFAQKPDELLKKGSALIAASRPFEAEAALQAIPSGEPQYATAQTMLGYLFLDRTALLDARESFSRALEVESGNARARLGQGLALLRLGRLHEAKGEFEKVGADPAAGAVARIQLIQCLLWDGKEDDALRAAQENSDLYPLVAEYQTLLGYLQQLRGNEREALQAYRRALDLQPYRVSNYWNLVSIYRARKEWKSTLYLLEKALQLDPNSPLLHQQIASVLEQLGRSEEAKAALHQAQLALDAELIYAQATRARIAGHASKAQELLYECVQTNPRLSKAWIDLGEALRQGNHLEEAARCFRRGIETDPANPLSRIGLALTLHAQGESARGVAANDGGPNRNMDERSLQAEAALRGLTRESPDNPDLLSYLGYVYESGGRSREAIGAYSEALNINPLQLEALLGKARSLLQRGDTQNALEPLKHLTSLEPGNAEAWQTRIQAHHQANDPKAEESACLECLSNLPSNSYCREQLARLKQGVTAAAGIARALSANFPLGKPRLVDVYRLKP